MIIECISNSKLSLPEELRSDYGEDDSSETLRGITVGKRYPVYAITTGEKVTSYAVRDDDVPDYPKFYDASLFKIIDASISPNWRVSFVKERSYPLLIAFEEWVKNGDDDSEYGFYGRLVDADPEDEIVKIWEAEKERMGDS